jgi:hypothetical protein
MNTKSYSIMLDKRREKKDSYSQQTAEFWRDLDHSQPDLTIAGGLPSLQVLTIAGQPLPIGKYLILLAKVYAAQNLDESVWLEWVERMEEGNQDDALTDLTSEFVPEKIQVSRRDQWLMPEYLGRNERRGPNPLTQGGPMADAGQYPSIRGEQILEPLFNRESLAVKLIRIDPLVAQHLKQTPPSIPNAREKWEKIQNEEEISLVALL